MGRVSALHPLKVCLVEDDFATRLFLRRALENLGHQIVAEAATGTDMVRLALETSPDLILFDIHLPHLDGLSALEQISARWRAAAVAITADRDEALVQRAAKASVFSYLLKPVEEAQLAPALLLAHSCFQQVRELQDENASLRQTLADRKIIDRAKAILISRHHWTEDEAFRRLQRGAMNRRISMVDLARNVLNGLEINL